MACFNIKFPGFDSYFFKKSMKSTTDIVAYAHSSGTAFGVPFSELPYAHPLLTTSALPSSFIHSFTMGLIIAPSS